MAVTSNYDGYITNESNSKLYYFRCVFPFKNKKMQPSIDIPLINTSAANRFLFRFTGQSQDISFGFVLYEDGDDTSNFQSITTVKEQAEYLMDEIFTHEFDTTWTLVFSGQYTGSITGIIDTLDLDTNIGGNIRTGTITFKRGRIGGL